MCESRSSYAQREDEGPLASLTASQSNDLPILLQLRNQLVALSHHVVVPVECQSSSSLSVASNGSSLLFVLIISALSLDHASDSVDRAW
jgi:hypothetical protein